MIKQPLSPYHVSTDIAYKSGDHADLFDIFDDRFKDFKEYDQRVAIFGLSFGRKFDWATEYSDRGYYWMKPWSTDPLSLEDESIYPYENYITRSNYQNKVDRDELAFDVRFDAKAFYMPPLHLTYFDDASLFYNHAIGYSRWEYETFNNVVTVARPQAVETLCSSFYTIFVEDPIEYCLKNAIQRGINPSYLERKLNEERIALDKLLDKDMFDLRVRYSIKED